MAQAETSLAVAREQGPFWAVPLFMVSLAIPIYVPIGPVLLMPHRIVLLLLFVPFFLRLFVNGQAGRVLVADWLLFGSACWAALALLVNHGFAVVEAAGIHMIEFFGAYMLARVAIRSSEDFRRMVWVLFVMLMVLLPFVVAESVLHRNILLEIIPGTGFGAAMLEPRLGLRRAHAIFAHPILLGVFVSTAFGLFWYVLRPRSLQFLGTGASAVATLCSLSTGAFLSVVVQGLLIGWETILKVIQARWRIFTAIAVMGYLAIDLLSSRSPFHVLVTYATFSTGSAYNRILIWNFGTANVRDNPIFGLGLNDWVRPSWMGDSVDNFWLLFAMRYGLPTIIMIFLGLYLILRQVSRAALVTQDDQMARAGYLVAFGGLFLAGGTVHYWHAMMAFAMFFFGSGLWAISGGEARDADPALQEETAPRPRSRYTRQPSTGEPIAALGRRTPAPSARRGEAGVAAGPDRPAPVLRRAPPAPDRRRPR